MNAKNDLETRYKSCLSRLSALGYISQGSVYARGKGQTGSRYQWSWKNQNQKTESLTLSMEQYKWLKLAIANNRKAEKIMAELRHISRSIMLKTIKGPIRRK